jgi:hypothetical protein
VVKFCYIDESESGDHRVVVAAGVVVDGTRMHATKSDWSELLATLSERLDRPLREFKAKDLYRGSGRWSRMAARDRGQVISDVVEWWLERSHKIVYSGVLTEAYAACVRHELGDISDAWCAADVHLLLALQRAHQRIGSNKGHTVVVLDRGSHEKDLVEFVRTPPAWTDAYYARPRRSNRLDQIVDVPYFVDSEHAMLVQTADLFAYILRRLVELSDLDVPSSYAGEADQVSGWAGRLARQGLRSDLWPTQRRTAAHELFTELTPPSLVALRGSPPDG